MRAQFLGIQNCRNGTSICPHNIQSEQREALFALTSRHLSFVQSDEYVSDKGLSTYDINSQEQVKLGSPTLVL